MTSLFLSPSTKSLRSTDVRPESGQSTKYRPVASNRVEVLHGEKKAICNIFTTKFHFLGTFYLFVEWFSSVFCKGVLYLKGLMYPQVSRPLIYAVDHFALMSC